MIGGVSKVKESTTPQRDVGAEKPFASFQKMETPPAYVRKSKAKMAEEPSTLPRSKAKVT